MIEKFTSLALNTWAEGGWENAERQAFISARRDLYEITDAQHAEVMALVEKLQKGVTYLGKAIDDPTDRAAVETEAKEYCSAKGCGQYADSLANVFMARQSSAPQAVAPPLEKAPSAAKPETVGAPVTLLERIPNQAQESEPVEEDSLIRRVLKKHQSIPGQKIWLAPDVPRDKFEAMNAVLNAASGVTYDDTLLYYDDTLLGNGVDGILLTDSKIFFRLPFQKPVYLTYEMIDDVELSGNVLIHKSVTWLFQGKKLKFTIKRHPKAADLLFAVFKEVLGARKA